MSFKVDDVVKVSKYKGSIGIIEEVFKDSNGQNVYKLENNPEEFQDNSLQKTVLTKEDVSKLDDIINEYGGEFDKLEYLYQQLNELKHRGHF